HDAQRRRKTTRRHCERTGPVDGGSAARRTNRLARPRLSAGRRVVARTPEPRAERHHGACDARPESCGVIVRTPGGHARGTHPGCWAHTRGADRPNRPAAVRRRSGRAVPSARRPPYGHPGPADVVMSATPGSLGGERGVRGRLGSVLFGYGALALAACVLAPLAGSTHISLVRAFDRSIPFPDNVDAQIFFVARMPRVLTGAIVGSTLAAGGVVMQALLGNPLATPFTLGVSTGAALGAVLAITFGSSLPVGALASVPLASPAGAA